MSTTTQAQKTLGGRNPSRIYTNGYTKKKNIGPERRSSAPVGEPLDPARGIYNTRVSTLVPLPTFTPGCKARVVATSCWGPIMRREAVPNLPRGKLHLASCRVSAGELPSPLPPLWVCKRQGYSATVWY